MVDFFNKNSDFLMVIISGCSVFLSVIAIFISVYTVISQNKFNRNSVRPFCDIKLEVLLNGIVVKLWNCGLGVMIIDGIQYQNESRKIISISDIFYKSACKTYAEWEYDDSSLAAGDSVKLLEASFPDQTDVDVAMERLENIVIRVNFHDIYNIKDSREFHLKKTCVAYKNARAVLGANSIVIKE